MSKERLTKLLDRAAGEFEKRRRGETIRPERTKPDEGKSEAERPNDARR